MKISHLRNFLLASICLGQVHAEATLQYFNTTWGEIERRIPELAERGYDSLWLPPPFKGGAGTYSVGFDTFDRFDLGDRDQMGTIRTKYGTKADLLSLMKVAHRFGIKVYFDNVMAHNAGPLSKTTAPGSLFPGIPGFVPEDFHLVRETDGTWRKAADWPDWTNEWQVLNRNPFAWDIANEYGTNVSFNPTGTAEGYTYPKWNGIRHAGHSEWYIDTDLTVGTNGEGAPVHPFANKEPFTDTGYTHPVTSVITGAGDGLFSFYDANSNGQHDVGEVSETFTDSGVEGSNPARQTTQWGYGDGIYNMGNIVAEDVNNMLYRSVRWFIDQTGADGFRLDAVKHVPSGFFGKQTGADKDYVNWGYIGQIQEQFNISRGFTDWTNHRDSNFNADFQSRDDAFIFGEHLGTPPAEGGYLDAGMRIANDNLLNTVKGGMGSSLAGYDSTNYGSWGTPSTNMSYVMSHDNNYLYSGDRALAHTYILTREGYPIIYTDGYNQAGSPDYFPKPSGVNFLGQFNDNSVTGSLNVHRDFARGYQVAKWSDQNYCAYERVDDREKKSGSWNGQTMLFMMARNYQGSGQGRSFVTGFPIGATLVNQSPNGGKFRVSVNPSGVVVDGSGNPPMVSSNQWFAFTWHNPSMPLLWQAAPFQEEHAPIEIYQGSTKCGTVPHWRIDGKDGDAAYNPYGVPSGQTTTKAYQVNIPRVTDGTDLKFLARADGSAGNILLKLDGGININSQNTLGPITGDLRDFTPGNNADQANPTDAVLQSSTDTYLGYEQMAFVKRTSEKFAARDISRNVIASQGAETYQTTIGVAGFVVNNGGGFNDSSARNSSFVFHDPALSNQNPTTPVLQMNPAPQNAANLSFDLWLKIGYSFQWDKIYVYYTTDGASYPEGIDGVGKGTTQVLEANWSFNGTAEPGGTPDWCKATFPAMPSGTVFRYKIGVRRSAITADVFPFSNADINLAERMETQFQLTGFNATTATYYPNNDLGKVATGLEEGYHVLRSRAFVTRNDGASIFKTNTQVFYYDTQRGDGIIRYPSSNGDTIGGTSYGAVVLTDPSITEVWYYIDDLDPTNDSVTTGNGVGNWVQATQEASPSNLGTTGYKKEWKFTYSSIPNFGTANIVVRLKEPSSSTNNALSDTSGWYRTLTRTINTGNSVNFNIGIPTTTGEIVDKNYVMRIYFAKALIPTGMTDAEFLNEVSIYISSTISGQADNPILQPRAQYVLNRDVNASEHSIAFTFPNLYNGNANFLHYVSVVHQRNTITLADSELVKMKVDETSDTDGDGIPDFWENLYGFDAQNPTGRNGALGDDDGDCHGNLDEFLTGMNPLIADEQNFPKLSISPNPGWAGEWKLQFPSISNRLYQMQYSSDLQTWYNWYGAMNTTGQSPNPVNTWIDNGWSTDPDPQGQPRRFYRMTIGMPQ